MAAGQDTGLQVNYKLPDGTLINIYAKNVDDLEAHLIGLSDKATIITATAAVLGVNTTPAGTAATLKVKLGAEEIQPDRSCKHGQMNFRTGANAKGKWQAWMCPSPKGTPDQCEPIWIR